ncbi:C45 family autoproteolytic acyltransferase/hydrolase [Streptomyces sp. NPDC048018]|uniref:C45 family autoproteolytic acyltransferase/hydolase n=1 Tax=Streptomyces sp. NPDC048018 TaxID=3365499 RepID=UPI003710B0CA
MTEPDPLPSAASPASPAPFAASAASPAPSAASPSPTPSGSPAAVAAFPFPRPAHRPHVAVADADPRRRGRDRGRQLVPALHGGLETYDRLFALGGIRPETVRDDACRALDAVDAFRPALREQIEGIAEGAGVEPWRIAALNARTEILARSAAVPPGECSTIVRAGRTPDGAGRTHVGVQTWDWHVELSPYWHTVESGGGAHRYAGLSEHGILAKIGVNSGGLALHFNILGHADDRAGGLPVHVLAALVLEEAGSVAHARELVESAPLSSSGSFLLFDTASAVLLDLSPVGVFEAPPVAPGIHLRTNHFLTPAPARREKTWLYQPDSGERFGFLRERLTRAGGEGRDDGTGPDGRAGLHDGAGEAGAAPGAVPPLPVAAEGLPRALVTGPGEPPVTCVPDPAAPTGRRWASLATVVLDPAARTARVLDGTPAEQFTRPWITLRA